MQLTHFVLGNLPTLIAQCILVKYFDMNVCSIKCPNTILRLTLYQKENIYMIYIYLKICVEPTTLQHFRWFLDSIRLLKEFGNLTFNYGMLCGLKITKFSLYITQTMKSLWTHMYYIITYFIISKPIYYFIMDSLSLCG